MSGARTDDTQVTPTPAESAGATPQTPASTPSSPDTSSPAQTVGKEPGESKETLLDAVLKVVPATPEEDVLAPKDSGDAPTSQPKDEAKAETDKAEESKDDDTSDEPPADATPVIRKKINKLLRQRRELRDEVATLQPMAQIGSDLTAYVNQHNLTGDYVAFALELAALHKAGSYKALYERMSPLVRELQELNGVVLPVDLQSRVEQGHMTAAAAQEFATTRFNQARAQEELEATRETHAQQQVSSLADSVQRAVSDLEARISANDPDYKAKADLVKTTAQALLHERGGRINSIAEALDITKTAYETVNRTVRRFQPAPRATAPSPNGSMQATQSARQAPRTMMEAALQGLERSRQSG